MGTWAPYPLRHHQESLNIEKTNARPGFRGKPSQKFLGALRKHCSAQVRQVRAAFEASADSQASGGGGEHAPRPLTPWLLTGERHTGVTFFHTDQQEREARGGRGGGGKWTFSE